MHGVVRRTGDLSAQKVHAVDGLPVEQPAAHQRTLGLATPVGLLVEVVDAQGVVRGGALEPVPPVGAPLGVGVTAGVDDERVAVPVCLDSEGVVVAVPPVAERAAAEDQEALVGHRLLRSPSAALHVVAADREVGATLGRRRALAPPGRHVAQVRGVEGVGREPQQVQVAVGVAVGQRGDVAVGSVQVHAEPQGCAESLVIRGRDVAAEAGDVDPRCHERAQGDQVVVAGPLAVHSVAPHVGEQVVLEVGPGS